MGAALSLREDYSSDDLKRLARAIRDANQTRRLLALSVIYDGGRRSEAAQIGGVGRQIVRDWVERSNAQGPDGLIDLKAPGNPSKLNDEQRAALAKIVERGPVRRWTASRWNSGGRTRPGSVKRTKSPAAGLRAARALRCPTTNARSPPISSAQSARRKARALAWSCLGAILPLCRSISPRSAPRSTLAPTRC